MGNNGSYDHDDDDHLRGFSAFSGASLSPYGTAAPSPPPLYLQSANQLWFNQKDVILDGWQFSYCRFDKCRIFVNSQNFELINCLIDEYSTIFYQNNTINLIKLFSSRFSVPFLPAQFHAIKNNDGTISIVR